MMLTKEGWKDKEQQAVIVQVMMIDLAVVEVGVQTGVAVAVAGS